MSNPEDQKIECPRCGKFWGIRTEQAVSVCKYGRCIGCMVHDMEDFDANALHVFDLKRGVITREEAERQRDTVIIDDPICPEWKTIQPGDTFHTDEIVSIQLVDHLEGIKVTKDLLDEAQDEPEPVEVRTIDGKTFNVPEAQADYQAGVMAMEITEALKLLYDWHNFRTIDNGHRDILLEALRGHLTRICKAALKVG